MDLFPPLRGCSASSKVLPVSDVFHQRVLMTLPQSAVIEKLSDKPVDLQLETHQGRPVLFWRPSGDEGAFQRVPSGLFFVGDDEQGQPVVLEIEARMMWPAYQALSCAPDKAVLAFEFDPDANEDIRLSSVNVIGVSSGCSSVPLGARKVVLDEHNPMVTRYQLSRDFNGDGLLDVLDQTLLRSEPQKRFDAFRLDLALPDDAVSRGDMSIVSFKDPASLLSERKLDWRGASADGTGVKVLLQQPQFYDGQPLRVPDQLEIFKRDLLDLVRDPVNFHPTLVSFSRYDDEVSVHAPSVRLHVIRQRDVQDGSYVRRVLQEQDYSGGVPLFHVAGWDAAFARLEALVQRRGGVALDELTLATHGLDETQMQAVVQILMEKGILKSGSKLIFDSCQNAETCRQETLLRSMAKHHGLHLYASSVVEFVGDVPEGPPSASFDKKPYYIDMMYFPPSGGLPIGVKDPHSHQPSK